MMTERNDREVVSGTLAQALGVLSPADVAVLCVGNPDRGDDGFGPAVAEGLRDRIGVPLFDGGMAPENELPRIADLNPQCVLVVDAVDFSGEPGELRLMSPGELRADDISTHAASLSVAAEFLTISCGARVLVLAAQPRSLELGDGLSTEVRDAVDETVRLLRQLWGE